MNTMRAATLADVPGIHALIRTFAEREQMLSLCLANCMRLRATFWLLKTRQHVACIAVHIVNAGSRN